MITLSQTQHIDLSADANMEFLATVKILFTFTITGTDHIEALLHKCTLAIEAADNQLLDGQQMGKINSYESDVTKHTLKLSQYLNSRWIKRILMKKPDKPAWDTYNQNIISRNHSMNSTDIFGELQKIVNTVTGVDWVNGVFIFQRFHSPPLAHQLMCLLDPRNIWKEPK